MTKRILFVGAPFPPAKAGSIVVMTALLRHLPKGSYKIITMAGDGVTNDRGFEDITLRVGTRMRWLRRFAIYGCMINTLRYYFSARRFARAWNPSVIVSPYPSLDYLLLGALLSKSLRIPFIPYLHDTIAEANEKTCRRLLAKKVQDYVFMRATRIMVMSDGMVDFYRRKYALETISIPHIYDEDIVDERVVPIRSIFWAGAVYSINDKALCRVYNAAQRAGVSFNCTSRENREHLSSLGIKGENITIYNLPARAEYLEVIKKQGVLVLALNAPDESYIGYGELSTIFPTKTPEYLAMGRPILVHCPEDYYLARFFRNNKCGYVVSGKSVETIQSALMWLLGNSAEVAEMCQNAKRCASSFSGKTIGEKFMETIQNASK